MNIDITIEWKNDFEIKMVEIDRFRTHIETYFKQKDYGDGLIVIWIILSILKHQSPRKRFNKKLKRLEFDIILNLTDFDISVKRKQISTQVFEVVSNVISSYKFENFREDIFSADLKTAIDTFVW